MLGGMDQRHEVRRPDDDELCGFIESRSGEWRALVVFGAMLGSHGERDAAAAHVLAEGLASLAERWTLRHRETGHEEIVCIIEANATEVTVALGYYAMPGVPTLTITSEQVIAGEWELCR